MIIITGTEFHMDMDTAVVLGKFDGIHLGHQVLLERLEKEKNRGLKTVAFTFVPLPDLFFGKRDDEMIDTYDERRSLFEQFGIDYLVEFPMNEVTSQIDATDFVREYLVCKLRMKTLIAGEDVAFGYRGSGNAVLLQTLSLQYDYCVIIMKKRNYKEREISSTYVREAIREGNMELTQVLLGRAYSFTGEVVHGRAIGRTLGMPTVNLKPSNIRLLPPAGVYFSKVFVHNKEYRGVSNLGKKPTVGEDEPLTLETNMLDCNEMLYDQEIRVELLHFYRPERRFDSLDLLKIQLQTDMEEAKKFFS